MQIDVIVVGGGHAGIEAANICARKKLSVLLITTNIDMIGQMSCNPAIGGIAKGNIVREVDALGGIMGRAADFAGIHFKMLNNSKGAAVWGNRAQADKKIYRTIVRAMLEKQPTLSMLQGAVIEIKTDGKVVSGVVLDGGITINARAIVLCMGTFLNGVGHIGLNSFPCGRSGEAPSLLLTESLNRLGISSARLKTGTSPRIDGRTVDLAQLIPQEGDTDPWPFSFATTGHLSNRVCCYIGRTTDLTHSTIRNNLDKSPLYSGKISSIGPRYCPSIEDKVVRFGERNGHTLFLEPEGLDTHEMYLNGLSTSLPFEIQQLMVNSIIGFERAKILRPGYAIEYDYFPPQQHKATLESKAVGGLFFAGQINGTSGYEEAAGQGIVAGINAAAYIQNEKSLVLGRDMAYTGVLIDDLVTRGTSEPYRMFTSRAEYRLILRQDNVDERLMPIARERGLIEPDLFEKRQELWRRARQEEQRLAATSIKPEEWNSYKPASTISHSTSMTDLLKRPELSLDDLLGFKNDKIDDRELKLRIEADTKYSGFIAKQNEVIAKTKKMEQASLSATINYDAIDGLLTESKKKLGVIRPLTLGQAARIPGITPADISVLMIYIAKTNNCFT